MVLLINSLGMSSLKFWWETPTSVFWGPGIKNLYEREIWGKDEEIFTTKIPNWEKQKNRGGWDNGAEQTALSVFF